MHGVPIGFCHQELVDQRIKVQTDLVLNQGKFLSLILVRTMTSYTVFTEFEELTADLKQGIFRKKVFDLKKLQTSYNYVPQKLCLIAKQYLKMI